jgi:hypothetical protein
VGQIAGLLAVSCLGGIAAGQEVAFLILQIRRRLTDPFQHNLPALVTSLAAYLLAETAEVSGILAPTCTWPSSTTATTPSSGCATGVRSTTRCSAACRTASTSSRTT